MSASYVRSYMIDRYREMGKPVQVDEKKRIAIIDGHRYRIEGPIPAPCLVNLPPANAHRQCELCRQDYTGRSELVGICQDCCAELGGGKHSARGIVAAERGQS